MDSSVLKVDLCVWDFLRMNEKEYLQAAEKFQFELEKFTDFLLLLTFRLRLLFLFELWKSFHFGLN